MSFETEILWTQIRAKAAIKCQVLVDFIAYFTPRAIQLEEWILNVN